MLPHPSIWRCDVSDEAILDCDADEAEVLQWESDCLEEITAEAKAVCPVGRHRCAGFVSYSKGRGRRRKHPVVVRFFTYHGRTYQVGREVSGRLDVVLEEILGPFLELSRSNPSVLFLELFDQAIALKERDRERRLRTG